MAYTRIKPRRGTNYEWGTVNPILDEGELGVVYPDTGVGTGLSKFKLGDGVHKYTELPWAFDGAAAAAIDGGTVENFHLIQLRSGTMQEWLLVNPVLEENEIAYDSTNHCFKVGDGVTAWEDLPYAESGESLEETHDYGDEDDASTLNITDITEGTSTLEDIIDNDTPVVEQEEAPAEEIPVEETPITDEPVIEDDPEAPEGEEVPVVETTTTDEPVVENDDYSDGTYTEIPDDEELQ